VTRSADILALLAAGKTTVQVVRELGCTSAQVYNAKWASKHPKRAPYVRPRPRHDLACELLDSGLTQEQAAAKMGVSVRTIQNYTSEARVGRPKGAVMPT